MVVESQFSRLVDSSSSEATLNEVLHLIALMDPDFQESGFIEVFTDIKRLFDGLYPGYRACNTEYHDFRHTCAVMLAMSRLIHGAFFTGLVFSGREIGIGMIAALMHDTGYIQESDDHEGTGAKYTLTHIERSIAFVREYFKGDPARGAGEMKDFADVLHCTGLTAKVSEVDFSSEKMADIGKMLGTADLLGQMADRLYLEKLLFLYREFVEGGVSQFTSEWDLLQKTVGFYEWTKQRFAGEFSGVDGYMIHHFRDRWGIDRDLYQESMQRNIDYIRNILAHHQEDFIQLLRRGNRGGHGMDRQEEQDVIARVRRGEREAYALLVDAYKTQIFNLAYRMTGSYQDAEDLAQEIFIRAYKNLRQFQSGKKFFTWLYTIALNLIRNHLKKRGREMSHETMDRIISEAGRPDIDRMERDIIQAQEIRRLEICLQKLPADLREAVILRFYQELSFEDAAEILKISLSAAKMRVYRGLEKLKGMMDERG